MHIGKLTELELRELWKNEERDFSAWIAKEENIEYLNEILGLTLTDVKREERVGSYECDIVAKDDETGFNIIIENQLENSNHDHLGKLITYASGLNANVIVWIVKKARDEHRSAIEWLNKNHRSIINEDVIKIYLDHDLGYGKTGYDFAKWFVEWNLDKNFSMTFHVLSNNPVGVFNIRQLFSNYGYKEF